MKCTDSADKVGALCMAIGTLVFVGSCAVSSIISDRIANKFSESPASYVIENDRTATVRAVIPPTATSGPVLVLETFRGFHGGIYEISQGINVTGEQISVGDQVKVRDLGHILRDVQRGKYWTQKVLRVVSKT